MCQSFTKCHTYGNLYQYRALRYERLIGDKKGISSLRINDQYRLEFREIASETEPPIIEICSLVDITNHYNMQTARKNITLIEKLNEIWKIAAVF